MKRNCVCGGKIRKWTTPKPGRIQIGPRLSLAVVLTHQCERCNCFYGAEAPPKEKQTDDN